MAWIDHNIDRPLPPHSTQALPGTAAKVEVMARRIASGYHPHHSDDARWDDAGVERVIREMMTLDFAENRKKKCK